MKTNKKCLLKTNKKYKQLNNYIKLLCSKNNISPSIMYFLKLVLKHTSLKMSYSTFFNHLLNGAYCIIKNDDGYIYKKMKKYNKYKKTLKGVGGFNFYSSHFSNDPQFRLGNKSLYNYKNKENDNFDLIVSTRPILEKSRFIYKSKSKKLNYFKKYQGDTWFQFEKNRLSNKHIFTSINYMINLLLFKMNLKKLENIGPFGKSKYTEYNPLIIEFKS